MGESVTLVSAADTEAHGAACGHRWRSSHQAQLLVGLSGGLGAGKTTWVRGLLRGLGVEGPVRSPTYTLVEPYELGSLVVVHGDLYRLADASELDHLGLFEWLERECCWVFVEWPERSPKLLSLLDLSVELSVMPKGRRLELASRTKRGASALEGLSPILEKFSE